jgi:subtilase family serine protease
MRNRLLARTVLLVALLLVLPGFAPLPLANCNDGAGTGGPLGNASPDHPAENGVRSSGRGRALTPTVPDIVLAGLNWSLSAPADGATLTIFATLFNDGTDLSSTFVVDLLVDGVSAGSPVVSGLPGGSFATVHATWTVRPGPHEIAAVADPPNKVFEANETNNLRLGYIDIPYPDLLVQNVSWYPTDYRSGDRVTFVVTVHNGGAGGTARPVALQSYIDQSQLENQIIGGLGPGSTAQASLSWTAQSGDHTLFLTVDPANAVRESTKTNNRATVRLGRAYPDLVVTNISLPLNLTDGAVATVGATVRNAGPAGTTATFPVEFLVDGDVAGVVNVYGLGANATQNISAPWTVRPGAHVLRVEADPDGRVAESSENNNFALREFVVAWPELVVQNVTWEQSLPTDGREVRFNITVANTGNGSTERPVQVRLEVDGQEGGTAVADGLAAGMQASLGAGWTAVPGRHELRVEADPGGLVDESDETDNVLVREISVPYPDISLSNLTLFPSAPESGQMVRLTTEVGNTGPGNTSRRFAVSFFAGGQKLSTTMVEGLDRGEVVDLGADWTARPGTTDLAVVADELDDIAELDELNDQAITRLAVAFPDISANITSWSPASAGAGQPLNVTASIRNGGANTSARFDLGLYDNGSLVGSVAVAGMRAGQVIVQNFTFVLRESPTTIRLVADYESVVVETSELNNDFAFSYPGGAVAPRQQPLDLSVREVRLLPDRPVDGETFTVVATVDLTTSGEPPGTDVTVGCVLDGISALERKVRLTGGEAVASFEIPAFPGAHSIIVTIDPEHGLPQSRGDNDQAFSSVTVLAPDPALAGLDPPAASSNDGDSVTLSCTVQNNGPGATRRTLTVSLFIDGLPRLSRTLDGLLNGTSSTVIFTFEAFPGTHRLKAGLVRDGRLRQTDLSDDQAFSTLGVERPELVPVSITAPAAADEGAPVTMEATVANRGATTVRDFSVRLFIDGLRLGDSTVGGLFSGRSTTVVREWKATAGAHRITVIADALGAVGESNEADNRLTVSAVNVSRPDLQLSNITLVQQPLDGAECLASADIHNAGNATTGPVLVQFCLDENQAGTITLGAVPAGASFSVSKRFSIPAGPHLLGVVALPSAGRPAEGNSTDNYATLAVNGTGFPDLVLAGLKVPPAAVDGATVRLFAELENAGGSTVRRFSVSFFVDGLKVGEDQSDGLPAGGTASCSAAWTATPGKHHVRAVADPDGTVPELDETDNSMEKDGLSTEPPDITVEGFSAVPAPAPGAPGQLRLFVTLENIGGPTLRGFSATVYLDDRPAGKVYSAGLPGRNSTQVTMVVPAGGASTSTVKADEEGALAEGDESNNAGSFPFAPVAEIAGELPDLVVRAVWMVPADPADGQPVRVFAAVGNDGNATVLKKAVAGLAYAGQNSTATVDALAPAGTVVVGFDAVAAGGDMQLNVTVDPGNALVESRKDNNWRTASYTAPEPALRAASLWRANTTEGLESPLFAIVENNGTGDNVTGNVTGDNVGGFTVDIYIGGSLYAQKAMHGLLAGLGPPAYSSRSTTTAMPPGGLPR